jgi:3'(2'), 5'-bisphosphate nucleotidase
VQLVGQYEWDLAGPVAVAAAAGLYASRVDGSPLRCNQADPRTPDLLVCRTDLAAGLVAALRGVGGELPSTAINTAAASLSERSSRS